MTAATLPTPDEDEDGVVTADGCHHESLRDALLYLLGACGCGDADGIADDATDALRVAATPIPDRDARPDLDVARRYRELLLGLLDRLGLVEHGGTITFAWTTPLGDQWLTALTAAEEAP